MHVEIANAKLSELKRICLNFIKFEGAMDLMMPLSRRGNNNEFCKSNRGNSHLCSLSNLQAKQKIMECNSLHQVTETFISRKLLEVSRVEDSLLFSFAKKMCQMTDDRCAALRGDESVPRPKIQAEPSEPGHGQAADHRVPAAQQHRGVPQDRVLDTVTPRTIRSSSFTNPPRTIRPSSFADPSSRQAHMPAAASSSASSMSPSRGPPSPSACRTRAGRRRASPSSSSGW